MYNTNCIKDHFQEKRDQKSTETPLEYHRRTNHRPKLNITLLTTTEQSSITTKNEFIFNFSNSKQNHLAFIVLYFSTFI